MLKNHQFEVGSCVCADYNPLTGSGSSGNYRPERRGGAMGGGGGGG